MGVSRTADDPRAYAQLRGRRHRFLESDWLLVAAERRGPLNKHGTHHFQLVKLDELEPKTPARGCYYKSCSNEGPIIYKQ
jgi:hypothetical protein